MGIKKFVRKIIYVNFYLNFLSKQKGVCGGLLDLEREKYCLVNKNLSYDFLDIICHIYKSMRFHTYDVSPYM